MPKYAASDDGKVVDGKIIVFLSPARGETAPSAGRSSPAEQADTGKLQAAALTSAARKGVPFCAECEHARRELASKSREPG